MPPLTGLRPSTANAASRVASDNVGWAWQMRARSSLAAPNSMATTPSEINSDAIGPITCIPRMRSVLRSARIFTNPAVLPIARARPLAVNGKLPAR